MLPNFTQFRSLNTSSNSHVNLNTNMPTPPPPYRNHQKRFVSGSFNRVPPPPTFSNNR